MAHRTDSPHRGDRSPRLCPGIGTGLIAKRRRPHTTVAKAARRADPDAVDLDDDDDGQEK
ncbi:hypothetical protein [Streptomyces sp. AK02-01A]|uniref:hypothetical protein n=1 Tax=Streptomyces sp. AK02-01A TaxID=3028648 RepID=UPI0029B6D8CD|nr:hypothetical protein [Streptomyces sp. AK02-01A]MDX3853244.1 hypothetical protein [Streptomyces sp. AK02-01A]